MPGSKARKIRKRERAAANANEKRKSIRFHMILGALFLLVIGAVLIKHFYTYSKVNAEAVGTIIRFSEGSRNSADCPVIEFYPLRQTIPISFTGYGSSFVSYSIGEKVQVLYDEKNPAHALIKNNFELYWSPGLLIFVFILIGGLMRAERKRLMKEEI
ncbi:MAG: hypothetical protein K0S33_3915 [Bacteroidetes bacterium]|jgi:hypothetical protein|nr:hypothetical protein [Bacteroidota bacterium]